jgi:hypothetical protein
MKIHHSLWKEAVLEEIYNLRMTILKKMVHASFQHLGG